MALVIQGYVRALSALESQITFLVPSLLPLPLCRFPSVPSSKLPFFWESRSVVSDSLLSHGLYRPWNSPGQNTGVAFPFPRGSSQPRDQTQVSHIAGGFFTS